MLEAQPCCADVLGEGGWRLSCRAWEVTAQSLSGAMQPPLGTARALGHGAVPC